MSKPLITKGEYHALVKIWRYSPLPVVDIRASTRKNLEKKGLIFRENIDGIPYTWLSDAGKVAMDSHVKAYGAMP